MIDFDEEAKRLVSQFIEGKQRLICRRAAWESASRSQGGLFAQAVFACAEKLSKLGIPCLVDNTFKNQLQLIMESGSVGATVPGADPKEPPIEVGASLLYRQRLDGIVAVMRQPPHIADQPSKPPFEFARVIDPAVGEELNQFDVQQDVVDFIGWAIERSYFGRTKEAVKMALGIEQT